MKAITLYRPYAEAVTAGLKWIETRSWPTSHRGDLFIHAAQTCAPADDPIWDLAQAHGLKISDGGVILSCVSLVDSLPMVKVKVTDSSLDNPNTLGITDHGGILLDRARYDWPLSVNSQIPWGIFEPGRFAHLYEAVRPLKIPVVHRGRQTIWRIDTHKEDAVLAQLP